MNTVASTQPYPSPPFHWLRLALGLGVVLVISSLYQAEFGEDWESYYLNLSTADLVIENSKRFWYLYFLLPLQTVLGGTDAALYAVKISIVVTFFAAYATRQSNNADMVMIVLIVALVPSMRENYQEFLRQGSALSLALLAYRFRPRLIRWPLLVASVLFHFIAVFPIAILLAARLVVRADGQGTTPSSQINVLLISIAMMICATLFCAYLTIFGTSITSGLDATYLAGNRSNAFALVFLIVYAIFVTVFLTHQPNIYHFCALTIICTLIAFYPAVNDFGRNISLIVPFHFAGSLTLKNRTMRLADSAAAVLFASAL